MRLHASHTAMFSAQSMTSRLCTIHYDWWTGEEPVVLHCHYSWS